MFASGRMTIRPSNLSHKSSHAKPSLSKEKDKSTTQLSDKVLVTTPIKQDKFKGRGAQPKKSMKHNTETNMYNFDKE